jgi:uroporphyrinogen decarboxylase
VPRIHFGVGTGEILTLMGDAGADVVGIDWRVPLDVARTRVPGKAVQGNLDPAVTFAGWDATRAAVDDVLSRNGGRTGHVFNLGHGVLPNTDPDVLARVVDHVHEHVHEQGRADGSPT